MLNQDTKQKIKNARDILVGKVPDPKAQVEQITFALIYKFMDDMDKQSQELGGKAQFFANGYEKYAWSKILDPKLGGHERLELYAEAITRMSENPHIPQLFRDVFKDAFLPYRSPETLSLFLKEINGFNYDHSEDLGDSFEYLLSILGSQGDAGQFRTPRHIIDFIVEVVNPKKDESILDPACGTAGFLISAYKHILKEHKNKPLNPDEKSKLMKNLVGYDISPDMVRLSKVNMYLHGFAEPKIYEYDTLSSEEKWDEMFDVIMANPPFMTPKGGIRPHKRFSVQANRAEVLFVDYIKEHLRPNGRAGIIVPEGIIFQSGSAYKQLRKLLIEDGLVGVVSLPSGVFNPYSGVKTSILLFDNSLAKVSQSILFIKIDNDGYDLGAQRREINANDLPRAVKVIREYTEAVKSDKKYTIDKNDDGLAYVVAKQKIIESGDYNFTLDRYKEENTFKNHKWPVIKLGDLEKDGKIIFLRGQGLSKKDIISDGKNKCIHYGEIYTLYTPIISKVISRTNIGSKITSQIGDILVPSTTTADAMGIAVARSLNENGVIIGGDINIIRTGNKYILADFLAYLISDSSLKKQLASYAKGVNILHLSNNDLRKLKFPLPPLDIQKKIVKEIEGKQAIIEDAKELIQKVERERANSGQIFERLKCEWVELGSLAKITSGQSPESKYYNKENNGTPFYQGKTEFGSIYLGDPVCWTTKVTKTANCGDILISVRAPVGPVNIATQDICIGRGLASIRPDVEQINPLFVFWFLFSNQNKIKGNGGAVFDSINREQIESIKIPKPSLIDQQKIIEIFNKQQSAVDSNSQLIGVFENQVKEKLAEVWGE